MTWLFGAVRLTSRVTMAGCTHNGGLHNETNADQTFKARIVAIQARMSPPPPGTNQSRRLLARPDRHLRRHRRQRDRRAAGVRFAAHVRLPRTHQHHAGGCEHATYRLDGLYQSLHRVSNRGQKLIGSVARRCLTLRTGGTSQQDSLHENRSQRHNARCDCASLPCALVTTRI